MTQSGLPSEPVHLQTKCFPQSWSRAAHPRPQASICSSSMTNSLCTLCCCRWTLLCPLISLGSSCLSLSRSSAPTPCRPTNCLSQMERLCKQGLSPRGSRL